MTMRELNMIAAVWRDMPAADKAYGLAFIIAAPVAILALMVVLP
jgi:hypothetical protein